MRLALVAVLLLCALGGVTIASASTVPAPSTEVTVEVAETKLEPGDSLEITVEVSYGTSFAAQYNYSGNQTVDVLATLGGEPLENTTRTVHGGTTETVEISEPMPEEGAEELVVEIEHDQGTETFEEDVVVGEPEIERFEFDDTSTVFSTEEWWIANIEVTYTDGPTVGVDHERASVTVDGETPSEPDRVDPEEVPIAGGSSIGYHADGEPTVVTLEAAYRGKSASEEVLFTDEVALTLDEDHLEVGEETTVTATAATPDGEHVSITDEVALEGVGVATVDGDVVSAVRPGEGDVLFEHHGLSAETSLDAVSPTAHLEIELPESVAPNETAPLAVEATDRDGETREITHGAAVEIENESVLGVEDGQLVGLTPGETTITATYEWQTANATVTVAESDGLPGPVPAVVALALALGALAARRWA